MATPPREPPIGQRFSHVYLDRGEPVGDSDRMRIRMRSLVTLVGLTDTTLVADRLGVEFYSWRTFFKDAEMRDILDFVTVAYHHLARLQYVGDLKSRQWLEGAAQIFAEENIHYRVDQRGGVRFYFDDEFARAGSAAIAILSNPRYANSLDAFNKSLASLREAPPDGKGAIRATFTAIEGLFCLMFPDVQRLSSGAAQRLKPLIERSCIGDRRAQDAADKLLQSLRGWIDAAHEYRHEEGKPDVVAQPPLTLVVYLVSSGAAHLRWLAELDASLQNSAE